MLRVRFHGRGGQGAKVASRVLGTAAFLEGSRFMAQKEEGPLLRHLHAYQKSPSSKEV